MTVLEAIRCPSCHHTNVVKHDGTSAAGKQRYCCWEASCSRRTFILDFTYRAYWATSKILTKMGHLKQTCYPVKTPILRHRCLVDEFG